MVRPLFPQPSTQILFSPPRHRVGEPAFDASEMPRPPLCELNAFSLKALNRSIAPPL